jgi:dolichyl-phosphate beta-glucosyltransferase
VKEKIYLSLVIPVYNETQRLSKGLKYALDYLSKQKYTWEVILVDDGSTDKTYFFAQKISKNISKCKILQHATNLGKGAAIRTGILYAQGKYILFSDIDFSTPITELPKLLKSLKNHQIAIGVRRHKNSRVMVHQKPLRELLGQCFTKLTSLVATPGIVDTTCGFKGYQNTIAKKLFTKMKIDRWAFDAEVIFLAQKYGYTIDQIPVIWSNDKATKVNMWQDGMRAFFDLLQIRANDIFGKYNN